MTRPKTIATASKKAERQLQRIPIERLRFDTTNPRILEMLPLKATQSQIRELLLTQMEARELVSSFIENGYLPYEPLVVRPFRDGTYTVVEGNRRLAALLSMKESSDPDESKAFAQKGLDAAPCLVFDGTPKEELAYLGLRHLSKTKDWSATAKAGFVERMLKNEVSLQDAARLTNVTSSALRQMLLVRRLFERAAQIGIDLPTSKAEGELTFWHLGDAVRRSNTKHYIELVENDNPLEQPDVNETKFERLVSWLYGNPKTKQPKLITSIRDIPALDQCLAHAASVEALESGATLAEAAERREAAGAKVNASLQRAKDFVQKASGALSDVKSEAYPVIEEARQSLAQATKLFDSTFAERKRDDGEKK